MKVRRRLHRVHAADGIGVSITFLDACGAAGRVLLGVRVHAEAAEGDALPCGYESMLRLEALLSVGVYATCRLPTACVDTAACGARRVRQARGALCLRARRGQERRRLASRHPTGTPARYSFGRGCDCGVAGARLRGRGVQARALDACGAAGHALFGVRVDAEAAEGDAPLCGYELMMGLEALLSVGVDAALTASLTRSCA